MWLNHFEGHGWKVLCKCKLLRWPLTSHGGGAPSLCIQRLDKGFFIFTFRVWNHCYHLNSNQPINPHYVGFRFLFPSSAVLFHFMSHMQSALDKGHSIPMVFRGLKGTREGGGKNLKNQAFPLDGVDKGGEGSQRRLGNENLPSLWIKVLENQPGVHTVTPCVS